MLGFLPGWIREPIKNYLADFSAIKGDILRLPVVILEIVFRWFSFFWFLSKSSITRVEVDENGDDGDDILSHHHLTPKLQTALTQILDELERNQKEENYLNLISNMMGTLVQVQLYVLRVNVVGSLWSPPPQWARRPSN